MSMRKRIFLLNMLMMVVAMLVLFFVTTGFVRNHVKEYIKSNEWITDIDANAVKIFDLLEEMNLQNIEEISSIREELNAIHYDLFLYHNNEILIPENVDQQQKEFIEQIQKKESRGMHTIWGSVYVDKEFKIDEVSYYLLAYPLTQATEGDTQESHLSLAFVYRIIFIGLLTIVVLLCMGWFFSKHLVKRITEPLELLVEHLKKTGRGDHALPIQYQGDKEFELVCEAFNSMQQEIQTHERERKEYEERRTDMINSISHDLRTPLTAIKGYIKAVLDKVVDSEKKQNEFLQIAYDTTGEMDQLLQQLFVFSKIETGKMPLDQIKLSMKEYLFQYVERRTQQYQKDKLVIQYIAPEEEYEGSYDILQMQRVFDNLLENSLRYGGGSPVVVAIRVEETENEEIISFHDNGVGVPEEKLPFIFERFYRCDEARSQEGNGVGLYIVKYIVEAQGGRIEAVNQNGLCVKMHFSKRGTGNE